MNVNKIQPSFGRLRLGKLNTIGRLQLPKAEVMENLAKNADVTIKSCQKDFPYTGGKIRSMSTQALEISARPLNLNFWERLFNRRTVTEYYPVGNMRDMVVYDKKRTVTDVIKDVVSKIV